MSWTKLLTKYGRNGAWRINYFAQADGTVRFFLLEPGHNNCLELLYTRVYDTVPTGAANIAADYNAAQIVPPGCCPECWTPLPGKRNKYCSPACATRAGVRAHYRRQREASA